MTRIWREWLRTIILHSGSRNRVNVYDKTAGFSTFFQTLSAAESKWPELLSEVTETDPKLCRFSV